MTKAGTLVKPPQSRRGKGLSLVYRTTGENWGFAGRNVYVKTQYDYNSRPSWRYWRSTPTFVCERRALEICEKLGLSTPKVLSFRTVDGMTELVVEEIAGAMTLPFFWAESTSSRVERVLLHLGRMVGYFHGAGWTHGAIAGGHILVQPEQEDRVWLIDFEKVRSTSNEKLLTEDLARFFRRSPYLKAREIRCFFTGYVSARGLEDHLVDVMAYRFKQLQCGFVKEE